MDKAIVAAITACSSEVELMTSDRLEALAGGHGMLNLAVFGIAEVILENARAGADFTLHPANQRTIPLDRILEQAIGAARAAGADPANAAMLSAVVLYLAGTRVQAGVPVGNRKLGALARMAAGVGRCGVAAMPTPKSGNKVSGFPAVQAIYEAMAAGKLSRVDGANIPLGVGALFVGHGALGEDHLFPEICRNAARIGTEAMLKAMRGAGMRPEPLMAALFGAAATLEIVHPDAWVAVPGEDVNNSAHAVGRSAAEAAGLPPRFHLRLTGEAYSTAALVGDLGLILKDSGGVTIPGMLTFRDVLGVFEEPVSGFRATTPPLGHVSGEAILALKAMLSWDFDRDRVARAVVELEQNRVDPEMALIALNTVARKARQIRRGELSALLADATDPIRVKGLYTRATKALAWLRAGRSLAEAVRELDLERKRRVEKGASAVMSKLLGRKVEIELLKVGPLGRKREKWGRFWALDMDADVRVTLDGESATLTGVPQTLVPQAVLEPSENAKLRELLVPAALPLMEVALAGHTTIDATVPAAVAAALGLVEPAEAGRIAEEAAFISAGVPGVRSVAAEVARRAVRIAAALAETVP